MGGCPCPSYDCSESIEEPGNRLDSVLVMQDNTAFLTNLNGELTDIEWSTEGATATDGFCSLIFENNVYIFGKGSSLEKTNFYRREIF